MTPVPEASVASEPLMAVPMMVAALVWLVADDRLTEPLWATPSISTSSVPSIA